MWKQNRSLFAYFRFMGYVMMIVGIYLIVNGIKDYAEQSRQKDWIPIEATVTDQRGSQLFARKAWQQQQYLLHYGV